MNAGLAFSECKRKRAQMRVIQTDRQTDRETGARGIVQTLCAEKLVS